MHANISHALIMKIWTAVSIKSKIRKETMFRRTEKDEIKMKAMRLKKRSHWHVGNKQFHYTSDEYWQSTLLANFLQARGNVCF